jgi:YD repeat-containing protein
MKLNSQPYRNRVPLSRDGNGTVQYTSVAYSVDAAGRTVAVDNPAPEADSTLAYDDDGRLAAVGDAGGACLDHLPRYDVAGRGLGTTRFTPTLALACAGGIPKVSVKADAGYPVDRPAS